MFALAVLTAWCGSASAQQPKPDLYLWGMPDIDQRRSGLLINGSSHCVPASFANLLLYIQQRGNVPFNALPGVEYPELSVEHAELTVYLAQLGNLMNTETSGTSIEDAEVGLAEYLGPLANLLTITTKRGPISRPDLYTPLASGGLATIGYGRWASFPNGLYVRDGGHCVTLVGVNDYFFPAQPADQAFKVAYRDPWTDEGNLSQQSTFATTWRPLNSFAGNCNGYPDNAVFQEVVVEQPGDRIRLIDTFCAIYPQMTLTQGTPGNIQLAPAFTMQDLQPPAPVRLTNVQQIAQGLLPTHHYVTEVLATGVRVSLVNFGLADVVSSVTIPGRDTIIATGRRGEVYVIGNGQLRCLAPDPNDRLLDGPAPLNFPSTPQALAYNDSTDELIVYTGNQISEFRRTLPPGVNPTTRLFATPPSFASSNRRMVVGDGSVRKYWFGPLSDGTIKAYQPDAQQSLRMVLVQSISIPGGSTGIADFQIDNRGNPIFLRNGAIQPLRFNTAISRWETNTTHPFNGLNLGGLGSLSITRSRTDYDPAIHNTPGWNANIPTGDVLGPSTPDCLADIGRQGAEEIPDGVLDSNDFIVFIRYFFASDLRADIAGQGASEGSDGAFDNNDFVLFIQRFFAGCN